MSYFDIMNIAATGMGAQRIRITNISSNLANAQTTKTADGGPYKRKDIVFQEIMDGQNAGGVKVQKVVTDEKPPIMKYEPDNPEANEEGYVAYPNINPIEEMVNMLEASRSYEANTTVLNTAKQLALRAIEIGKA